MKALPSERKADDCKAFALGISRQIKTGWNALNDDVPHSLAVAWLEHRDWDVDRAVADWNREVSLL